ncbi:MAG: hypothetical protein K2H47_04030 [Muribaculaceae bacterium]|nr:hypothetical protein [Muribaculaceae bacterium]
MMSKNLLITAAFIGGISVPAAAQAILDVSTLSQPRSEIFRFAPTFRGERAMPARSGHSLRPVSPVTPARIAPNPDHVLGETNDFGYLYAPNNDVWYYTLNYDYEYIQQEYYTQKVIKGWHYKIYDATFSEIADIEGTIELGEGETGIAGVDLGPDVTQKFFNYDNYYEFMVMVATTTENYVNNYRTLVYSSDPAQKDPIAELEGYYVSAINAPADKYSEEFYITFLNETEAEQTDIYGVQNVMDYKLSLYTKSGYNGGPQLIQEFRVPAILLSAPDAPFFLAEVHNGKPYFALSHLKYSFYENPWDYTNENLTPDNTFDITLYSADKWDGITELSTTSIPVPGQLPGNPFTFLSLGTFSGVDDLCFNRYTSGDTPAYIVTYDHYLSTDSDIYDYMVYDVEGNLMHNIAEGVSGGIFMTDIRGIAPQVMFTKGIGTEEVTLEFIDLVTCETVMSLPQYYEGLPLTAQIDRTPFEGSYVYAVSLGNAYENTEGDTIHSIAWLSADGTPIRVDEINLGKNVAYAQVYINGLALSPYAINTDSKHEYMFLVKRFIGQGSATQEELVIINTDNQVLLTCEPSTEYGVISSVNPIELGTPQASLDIIYVNYDTDNLSALIYDLPFNRFAGGDGTADNPYLIATAGDLQQMVYDSAAHYLIVNDIDARGLNFTTVPQLFTGSLDGGGHIIDGLNVGSGSMFAQLEPGSEVHDIIFTDPVAEPGSVAFIAKEARGAKIYGLTIRRLTYSDPNEDAYGDFGTIAYRASNETEISLCAVLDASLTLPDYSIGGIVGSLRTSATINACVFSGTILGGSSVGGILADDYNAGGVTNCHVNADITAKNTIGGIIGLSNRGIIHNCHVQGTITATEPARRGGLKTGGIAGELDPAPTSYTKVAHRAPDYSNAVIAGCYVSLSELTGPELDEGEYAGQNDTMHRIVGKSRANEEPDIIDYDEDGKPIYGNPHSPERALRDNYVISTLVPVSSTIGGNNANSTEGASVAWEDLDIDFFENIGFIYGESAAAPWALDSFRSPALYIEKGTLQFTPDVVEAVTGEPFYMALTVVGENTIDLDTVFSDFLCETSDDSNIYMTGEAYAEGNTLYIQFVCESEGTYTVTAGFNGMTATATVNAKVSGITPVIANAKALTFDGNTIKAAKGDTIVSVFTVAGTKVAEGRGQISVADLTAGVYVARTENSALKFILK